MHKGVWLYVLGVVAAAAAATAAAVLLGERSFEPPWLIAALAAAIALEQILSIRLSRGSEGESLGHEEAFVAFMVLLLSPAAALAALAVGVLAGQTVSRFAPVKIVFNVAQFVGSGALAFLTFGLLSPDGPHGPRGVAAALAGVLVFALANRLAISGVLAVAGAARFRSILADDPAGSAMLWTGSVSMGLLAGLAGMAHAWAHPIALGALVALSIAFSGHTRARSAREAQDEIMSSGAAVIFSVDRRGLVRTWNRELERVTGRPEREAVGRPLSDVLRLSDASGESSFDPLSPSVLNRPGERQTVSLVHDGGERWLTLSRATLADGGFAFVAQDTSEQRSAEQRYRRLVEQLPLAVYSMVLGRGTATLPAGRYVGPQIEAMLGYPQAAIVADPGLFTRLIHPDDRERVLEESNRARSSGAAGNVGEYRVVARDGRVVWVHDVCVYLRDGAGELIGVEGYLVDVSERRELEAALIQTQKMDAIGRLAGGVAHDFNNLMSAVVGFGELALADLDPEASVFRQVAEMVRAGERASRMTQQLLAFSRKQVLRPRRLDLNRVVADSKALLARLLGEDIEIVCVLDPASAPVEADPVQLEQVIVNLAVNARDAMPRGGRLTIRTSTLVVHPAAVDAGMDLDPGASVVLSVSDTGTGMDAETASRVFEPFFTTKPEGKGTGLGLATVFGIVKQSGGDIAVESEPGRGTTFLIYLPRVEGPREESLPGRALKSLPRGSETILLVEDEDLVRRFEHAVLTACGYTVIPAVGPSQALELAAAHDGPLDLLLTDVVMPELSGLELATRIRAVQPGLRVVFCSGYTEDEVLRHGVREAEVEFLSKPLTALSLATRVREVLDSPLRVSPESAVRTV